MNMILPTLPLKLTKILSEEEITSNSITTSQSPLSDLIGSGNLLREIYVAGTP